MKKKKEKSFKVWSYLLSVWTYKPYRHKRHTNMKLFIKVADGAASATTFPGPGDHLLASSSSCPTFLFPLLLRSLGLFLSLGLFPTPTASCSTFSDFFTHIFILGGSCFFILLLNFSSCTLPPTAALGLLGLPRCLSLSLCWCLTGKASNFLKTWCSF